MRISREAPYRGLLPFNLVLGFLTVARPTRDVLSTVRRDSRRPWDTSQDSWDDGRSLRKRREERAQSRGAPPRRAQGCSLRAWPAAATSAALRERGGRRDCPRGLKPPLLRASPGWNPWETADD